MIEMTLPWSEYQDEICKPIEDQFIGERFTNRDFLTRAIMRRDKLEKPMDPDYKELHTIGHQDGLDTIGDKILDFMIFDHFIKEFVEDPEPKNKLKEKIHQKRMDYGGNEILQIFSQNRIHLYNRILWSDNEWDNAIWKTAGSVILATCFEALVAAVYLDKGIKGVKQMFARIKYFDEIKTLNAHIGNTQ